MDYIVSPSIVESFGYSIAEAMLKGIKPLIRDRQGAREMWPEECVWRDVGDFEALLQGPYDSARYRDWVLDRYSLERQFAATDALLKDLMANQPDAFHATQVSMDETRLALGAMPVAVM